MKIVIIVVVLLVVVWLVRAARKDTPSTPAKQPPTDHPGSLSAHGKPTTMLQCHHCGLHLPMPDAIQGRLGPYCTDAHRRLSEN